MPLHFMSDRAHERIVQLAQRYGYTPYGAKRAHGLSEFLNDLVTSNNNYIDTRPDLVKKRHEEEIFYRKAPTWRGYNSRRAWTLNLSDEALNRFCEIALSFGIVTPEPPLSGGPVRTSKISIASSVLEGIGLGWITPLYFPRKNNAK